MSRGPADFVGSFTSSWPELGVPEVAFAGRSNVGKSSALNALLNTKKLVRVSSRPGRTQAINLFRVGRALSFADLPGYGFAKVPEHVRDAWKAMIGGYLGERETLRLVIVLVDARRDPTELDGTMVYGLREARLPYCVVATKVDKLRRSQRGKLLGAIRREFALPSDQPVPFSAVSREGVDAVWARIESACTEKGR